MTTATRELPTAAAVGSPLGVVPPATVPLGFFAAAAVGLVGFGLAAALAAERIVSAPALPGTIAAVHLAVLAFLTVGVLGALHQFSPVIGRRPLRSVLVARLSFAGIVITAWMLPTGFAHGPENLIPAAGVVGSASVLAIAWNLSGPLLSSAGGLPAVGLRWSLSFLVATVAFGSVYAFDRQTGWFPLLPNKVLAHAHLGLLGWLGLTYVAVAEKLWPMFLLSHRPSDRSGRLAVWGLAGGVVLLTPGLLFAWPVLAWPGGVLAATGLVAHLVSFASYVHHRRRGLELLHAFVAVSSAFLVAALVLALVAAAAPIDTVTRVRFVGAEVAALIAWLTLAILGHVHKIVPFIGYNLLRSRGISRGPGGTPLLFAHLFARRPARVVLVVAASAWATILAGLITATMAAVVAGGFALSAAGLITAANLVLGFRRAAHQGGVT